MRQMDKSWPMYNFYLDSEQNTLVVLKYNNMGPQKIFVKNEDSSLVASCFRARDFKNNNGEFAYFNPALQKRLRLSDPIIRDVFSPDISFEQVIHHYKLRACSSVRGHHPLIDELMKQGGIYNGA